MAKYRHGSIRRQQLFGAQDEQVENREKQIERSFAVGMMMAAHVEFLVICFARKHLQSHHHARIMKTSAPDYGTQLFARCALVLTVIMPT